MESTGGTDRKARPKLVDRPEDNAPEILIEKRDEVSVDQVVDMLNGALRLDEIAVTHLVQTRVDCNKELAEHPTIQVGLAPGSEDQFEVGILGILNGLFGIDENSWGAIAAEMTPDGHVQKFVVREPWSGVFQRVDA